ncbi:MAG: hypothetical protein IKL01_02090, partial [Mailhella sp.]|nr:hypothetical protein [Mailhella sp.]
MDSLWEGGEGTFGKVLFSPLPTPFPPHPQNFLFELNNPLRKKPDAIAPGFCFTSLILSPQMLFGRGG